MIDLYDKIAPHYRSYSDSKKEYLNSVNNCVLDNIPAGSKSLLDVGAGDGIRAMTLAGEVGIEYVVLADPSSEMIQRCKDLNPAETWLIKAEELPEVGKEFDVILCLWNVMGHIENHSKRLDALKKMKNMLSNNGVILLDVNNRHNYAYGKARVAGRILIDAIYPDERRGDTSFDWNINGQAIPAMGHLFTPREIRKLIFDSGLIIKKQYVIDYNNGKIGNKPWHGQMLFCLTK